MTAKQKSPILGGMFGVNDRKLLNDFAVNFDGDHVIDESSVLIFNLFVLFNGSVPGRP